MKTLNVYLILLNFCLITSCCCEANFEHYSLDNPTAHHLNNEGVNYARFSGSEIPAKAYGIQLEFEKKESEKYANDNSCNRTCDDYYEPSIENPVTRIKITALSNFDSLHPAGSDITHYFRYASTHQFEDDTIPTFFNKHPLTSSDCCASIELFLYQPPQQAGIHRFLVQAETYSENFVISTDPITLTLD